MMEVNEKRELGRILKDAQVLINGTRQDQYGNPGRQFQNGSRLVDSIHGPFVFGA